MRQTHLIIYIGALALALGVATPAVSKEKKDVDVPLGLKNSITTRPFRLMNSILNVSYERALFSHTSFVADLAFARYSTKNTLFVGRPYNAYSFQLGMRFYFPAKEQRRAIARAGYLAQGFFFQPALSLGHMWRTYETFDHNVGFDIYTRDRTFYHNVSQCSFLIGYRWITRHHVDLELNTGFNWTLSNKGAFENYNTSSFANRLRSPFGGFKIGYAF